MKPVKPRYPHRGAEFVEIAKRQPEYQSLPAFVDPEGLVLTEWEPSDEDRRVLANGGRIRLWTHTFGHPLQPIQMEAV